MLLDHRDAIRSTPVEIDPEYLAGLDHMALTPDGPPSLESLRSTLAPLGWGARFVPGYVSPPAYAELLAQQIFPVARPLRKLEHKDFAPAPDLLHDILGHMPMLFSRRTREFIGRWANLMRCAEFTDLDRQLYAANRAMSAAVSEGVEDAAAIARRCAEIDRIQVELLHHPSAVAELGRLWLWSVEFGVLGTAGRFRVAGAGLLSARNERDRLRSARLEPFSLDVVRHDVAFSSFQNRYFIARDHDHWDAVLDELRTRITTPNARA